MPLQACSGTNKGVDTVVRRTAITTAVDVVSDIVVLSFPALVLPRMHVDVRQKFALGLSLCLSIIMIVVAVVRMAGIRLANDRVDIVWLVFWQQQESSIAVIIVSLSAVRALFVAKSMHEHPRKPGKHSLNDYWRRGVHRRRLGQTTNEQETNNLESLPRVPSPTLSGMSSVIRRP